ncbi:MAG: aminotransferase [Proteobacteria bacterium]|nr:aminotransferase [Pseudomonadota bacterium]MDA0951505.1 aminotransferase [Pseudomonadota bacterium]MDA1071345.1 aminotransferase [Pseudomonadota bacterium]
MLRNVKYDAQDLWQKDHDHVIHPWTNFADWDSKGSDIMAEAEGIHVYDTSGNKYIDGIGGLWCVNIGYGREEMAEAVAEQIRAIPYYSPFNHLGTPPQALLGAKIAELTPGDLNHMFFGTGGSMANDTAIRFVHFYWNNLGRPTKKKIISRVDAYHGTTYMTAALTGIAFDKIGFDQADHLVEYVACPYPYRRPDGMSIEEFGDWLIEDLRKKIETVGAENIGAMIAEPIMGAGGVIVPPPGYHKRTRDLCAQNDILYISDEVVTGFGRLGHFFASEAVFDLMPDIITSAKGISSGYQPLSATIINEKMYEVLSTPQQEGALFTTGFTYSGHPACCAAGLKNIEIMEREDIPGHVRKVGPYFEKKLHELADMPLVGEVRGKCFMMCIENVADKATRALLPPEVNVGGRIAAHAQKMGLIVRPLGHLNIMSPPLIMTEAQIDEFVGILKTSIEKTQDDLVRENLWHG